KADPFGDRIAFRSVGLAMGKQVVHGGAFRIGDPDHDLLVFRAQIARYAGEGAAGTDGADEAIDAAVSLLPDFRPRREVMRPAVIEIVPLIGKEDAVGLVLT